MELNSEEIVLYIFVTAALVLTGYCVFLLITTLRKGTWYKREIATRAQHRHPQNKRRRRGDLPAVITTADILSIVGETQTIEKVSDVPEDSAFLVTEEKVTEIKIEG